MPDKMWTTQVRLLSSVAFILFFMVLSVSFNANTSPSLSSSPSSLAFGQIGNSAVTPLLPDTTLDKESNASKPYSLTSTNDSVLPSWTTGTVKETIVNFVENVTTPESPNYVPPEDRIAVFDNDGTMWSEKPIPFQGFFLLDRLEEISTSNLEIKQNPKIQQLLERNFTNLQLSEKDVMSLALLTHSNISETEFDKMVGQWAQVGKHPQTGKLFVEMVFQPMIELIDYLKDNSFKTFIVSGGGVDFMRESLSKVYGIPPDQIIGSSGKYRYVDSNTTKSFIFKEPELVTFNNAEAKPENIHLYIGKVPIIAAGNSDGDLQMLKYTDDSNKVGQSLEILVHHDDGVREYSYEKGAESALQKAKDRNWSVVSMKNDFKDIFPNGK
jgi:hypothetical protein